MLSCGKVLCDGVDDEKSRGYDGLPWMYRYRGLGYSRAFFFYAFISEPFVIVASGVHFWSDDSFFSYVDIVWIGPNASFMLDSMP